MREQDRRTIDPDRIPELATIVGMAGTMRRAEVGGQGCTDTGVLVATVLFGR